MEGDLHRGVLGCYVMGGVTGLDGGCDDGSNAVLFEDLHILGAVCVADVQATKSAGFRDYAAYVLDH